MKVDPSHGGGVLLLGIMQSGKTALFRRLCGEDSDEVLIPGSTERVTEGRMRRRGTRVLDTPGTATLFAQGADEAAARDALLRMEPDVILVVMDQKNMRRSLALAIHAAEMGLPMVVAVNMRDEAIRHGIDVDYDALSAILGVDVVPTVAVEGEGTNRLIRCLERPRVPSRQAKHTGEVERAIERIEGLLGRYAGPRRGLAMLLLARDRGAEGIVAERLGQEASGAVEDAVREMESRSALPIGVVLTDALYRAAERVTSQVASLEPRRRGMLDRLGRWSQHPATGIPIAMAAIALVYLWVGVIGATWIVDTLDTHVFEGFLVPLGDALVAPIPWALVRDAIMDPDFGLLPTGLFLAFGILMPVIFMFYLALEVLQQSGYLARLSILLDRLLRVVGLNGKGVMPIVMGFSCITMALFTTRMLDTRKQRIIASLLLILGIPCAPLLSVMLVILADMPVTATLFVFGVIAAQVLLAGILTDRLLPGLQPDFVMVIPPMRVPRLRHALVRSTRQTYYFMREAVPFFLAASLVLFAFDRVGGLVLLERAARPLMNGLLGLPDSAMHVFIKTLIRRESGAAELNLLRSGYTNLQLVTTLLVMTSLSPCVNAVIVLAKERGARAAFLIIGSVSVYAIIMGGIVNHVCRLLGVTFGG
jgi:ferrous iron transport protein B